ncbi:type II toxin-antitoxin system Phd/YefM family antitoxin [Acinetobacter pittii]|uniref:type II toxin-antitoxin system Phd/YefM family antitoxin n=1 Tax=Acinetobacter pittii TaxID=48296 RepID=UPI003AF71820
MDQLNYTNAKAQFSMVMERALLGYPVKITRAQRDSVILISEKSYLEYKKALYELNKIRHESLDLNKINEM